MENIQAVAPEPKNETVGFWTYFGLSALFALPVVGLIAAIVFAFAPKNKSLKNYARVMMTWCGEHWKSFCWKRKPAPVIYSGGSRSATTALPS